VGSDREAVHDTDRLRRSIGRCDGRRVRRCHATIGSAIRVQRSGFLLTGAVVVVSVLLVVSFRASRGLAPVQVAVTAKEEAVEVTQRAHELACKQLVELVADYVDDALSPDLRARFEEHLAGCDGCTTYLSQTQQIIAELRNLSDAATPEHNR
jgi:hypothetical protein